MAENGTTDGAAESLPAEDGPALRWLRAPISGFVADCSQNVPGQDLDLKFHREQFQFSIANFETFSSAGTTTSCY